MCDIKRNKSVLRNSKCSTFFIGPVINSLFKYGVIGGFFSVVKSFYFQRGIPR